MLLADEFLGPIEEDAVGARVADGDPLEVTVEATERRRSRFRTTAEDGTDIGIVVARDLTDGDVLVAGDRLVVVSLDRVEAVVVDFEALSDPGRTAVTSAIRLGHAVGTRHWDLAVERGRVYIRLSDSRQRLVATIRPHLPGGATVGTETVSPALFDDARGGNTPAHTHDRDPRPRGKEQDHPSHHDGGETS